jgi:hypothetical protein
MRSIDMTNVTLEQVTIDLRSLTQEVNQLRELLDNIPFGLHNRLKWVENNLDGWLGYERGSNESG